MLQNSTLFQKILITATVIVFSVLTISAQSSYEISVTNYAFNPDELTIQTGDTVIWINSEGNHNVNGTTNTYPLNPESFGNSVGSGWTYNYVFTIAGVYDYQCDPHVSLGMTGTITVEGETNANTLTIHFMGMDPHIGQKLTLYLRDQSDGNYLDTLVIESIPGSDFDVSEFVVEPGSSYYVDFYADHNGNGEYDAPPVDHAWRISVGPVNGDTEIDFTHNTSFTDIFETTSILLTDSPGKINIYPVPAGNELFINTGTGRINKILIFDIAGKQVYSQEMSNQENVMRINIETLKPGVYILKARSKGKTEVQRFIKK